MLTPVFSRFGGSPHLVLKSFVRRQMRRSATRLNHVGNWLGQSAERSSTSRHCTVSPSSDAIIGKEGHWVVAALTKPRIDSVQLNPKGSIKTRKKLTMAESDDRER